MTDDEFETLAEIEKRATPGPWAVGYAPGGRLVNEDDTFPRLRGTPIGQCVDCGASPLVREWGAENGRAHVHRARIEEALADPAPEPRRVFSAATGEQVCGLYDHDEGGVIEPHDAALIVAMRNALPELLAAQRVAVAYDAWLHGAGAQQHATAAELNEAAAAWRKAAGR